MPWEPPSSQTLDAKVKQKELVDKSPISGFINNDDLDKKVATLATKAELKAEQEKIAKLETYDINYLLGKNFLVMMLFKICLFMNQTFSTLELKPDKDTEDNSKLVALHGAFSPNIKYFKKSIGIQFNNTRLVVEQNHYTAKTNVYIVHDLDNWLKVPLRNFTLKNYFLTRPLL